MPREIDLGFRNIVFERELTKAELELPLDSQRADEIIQQCMKQEHLTGCPVITLNGKRWLVETRIYDFIGKTITFRMQQLADPEE